MPCLGTLNPRPSRIPIGTVAVCAAFALLAGCGASRPTPPGIGGLTPGAPRRGAASVAPLTASTTRSTPTGPLLVYFKRVVGVDPLASQLTVYAGGASVAIVTAGGVSGEHRQAFTLPAAPLRRLRRLIGHARLRDMGCSDARVYCYFVTVEGHAWRLQQGEVPGSLRPLLADLNAITDVHTNY